MKRHLAVLVAVATAAIVATVAQAGTAATIKLRIEGKTATVFGTEQPEVTAANAMDALKVASADGSFTYHVKKSSFGPYIDRVGSDSGAGSNGWAFKVNNASPPVGADKVKLKDGDVVIWYFATFGKKGGPATLVLEAAAKAGCYKVTSFDDAGKASVPKGAALEVDGKKVALAAGVGCPGKHAGGVRAVAPGAVRSNTLR